MSAPAPDLSPPSLSLHPQLQRRRAARSDRRRTERFVAHIRVDVRSRPAQRFETIDVSQSGLLVPAYPLPPLKQPLMLTLHLPDGPLSAMAVVVRHSVIDGRLAMGLMLCDMPRERELRWLRALAQLAHTNGRTRANDANKVDATAEVNAAHELRFDIDVVLDGSR